MEIKNIRILYFGTPSLSAKVLERLINDGFTIVGLVTQEDKPQGRKNIITPSPCKQVALKYNIPVFQPHRLRLDFEFLKQLDFDIFLTLAYGQIISQEILDMPKLGCYNLHGSILPKYRGAAPIQYALLNNDKETGVTLMEMIDKCDAGKMYYITKFLIDDDDNYTSLCEKISDAAYDAFVNGIGDVINGVNIGIVQKENEVTLTKKILKEDEVIDFNNDSLSIIGKIRALSLEPGAYFKKNNENIKIFKAILDDKKGNPGEILQYDKNSFVIATKNGSIKILELQKPGKKILSFKDFFNGNQHLFEIGERI